MKRSDFAVDFTEIRSIDPNWLKNLYWHVSDRVAYMPWPSSGNRLKTALAIAPEGVRRFYLTDTIQGPVENGGLGQYFGRVRHTWLHEMAKQAVRDFRCPKVVAMLDEAEDYMRRNRDKLHDGMSGETWTEVMGVVAMNEALNNINRRFLEECETLNDAKERYLRRNRKLFR